MLRLALQTEPSTLDPAYAVDYSSGMISSLIHSNLVRFDPEGKILGDLAEGWEVSEDGMKYTFRLTTARFSSGRNVNAEDVVYSFKRLLDPSTMSPRWWVLEPIRGAENFHGGGYWDETAVHARDDSTLVLYLNRPAAHLLSLLTMPSAGIVCREEIESSGADYGRSPCGCGAWKLVEWREGERLLLERNSFYTGAGPHIDGISIRIIPESMTRIAEYEVGNLDVLEIPRAELSRWKESGVPIIREQELRIVYIGLNNEKPPFNIAAVRRALNMAIDVDAIISRVIFSAGIEARGIIPPALRLEPIRGNGYGYDPQQARKLLADAGYPDGFRMEIWQRENPEGGRILESVQGYLYDIGVDAELVTREWSAFKMAVDRGTPDAFYLDWFADYPDAENFMAPLFHSANAGGGGNRARYANNRVDSLFDAAALTPDAEARWRMYEEAESLVYHDAPWIFLWFPTRYEAVSDRVEGYRIPAIFNAQRYLDVSL